MYSKEKFSIAIFFPCGFDVLKASNFTGNDRDVNSGLQASRKTDLSVIFLLWANQFAKKWWNSALLRKCRKNLFFARLGVLKWRHNRSLSPVLVSRFCTPPEVKFLAFGTLKQGEGISLSKKKIAILISTLGRFDRANKKNMSSTL